MHVVERVAQRRQVAAAASTAGGSQSRTARLRKLAQRQCRSVAAGDPAACLRSADRSASAFLRSRRRSSPTRRYSGCTISRPPGPRRISPKQRRRVPRASPCCCDAGEMKEAQRQRARAVADAAQQLAPAAKRDFGSAAPRLRRPRARRRAASRSARRACDLRSAAAAGTTDPGRS